MSRYLQIANVRNNAQAFVTGSTEILAEKNAFQPERENSPQLRILSISHMVQYRSFLYLPLKLSPDLNFKRERQT